MLTASMVHYCCLIVEDVDYVYKVWLRKTKMLIKYCTHGIFTVGIYEYNFSRVISSEGIHNQASLNFFPQITKAKSTFREHCIGIGALQPICMSKEDTKVLLTFVLWAAAHVGETEKSSLRGSGKKNEEQNCKKEVEERCLCWLTLCYWFLSALKKIDRW